jgi:tRNA pseudouridine38-40 synthase
LSNRDPESPEGSLAGGRPAAARRLKATLAYDGTDFFGWQIQPGLPTIQGTVESVLAGIEGFAVQVASSGRTDAGVHALAQPISFDLANPIPADNLRRVMNRLLPPAIRVLAVEPAADGFHARHHAIAKTYEYRILRGEVCSPFERRYVHHHPYPLDVTAMIQLAPHFEGTRDFRAFAASDDRYTADFDMTRTIFSSALLREADRLIYRVRGSGFLKHMVRNLAGTLIEAGRGNLDASRFPDRCGHTTPACGLFLVSVEYPPAPDSH